MNIKYSFWLGILFFSFLYFLPQTNGQSTFELDMDVLLKRCHADARLQSLYTAKQQLALAEYKKAKKWWWPTLYGGFTSSGLLGTAQNTDGRFFRDIRKHNLWAGLGIDATWDLKEKYRVQANSWAAKALSYAKAADQEELLLDAIEEYFTFKRGYATFFSYVRLVEKSTSIAEQYQKQVARGLKPKSDYLIAKSRVNAMQSKAVSAYRMMKRSEAALIALLDLPADTEIELTDTLYAPLSLVATKAPDWSAMLDIDPKLHQIEMQINGMEAGKQALTKGRWLPKLFLNTNGSLFGGTFDPFDPTGVFRAGALWQIPLHQLKGNADLQIAEAKIATMRASEAFIRRDRQMKLMQALQEMTNLEQQMEVAEAAKSYALEAFDLILARQQKGVASPLELFEAEEQAVQTTIDYLHVVLDYNYAQYRYLVLTRGVK